MQRPGRPDGAARLPSCLRDISGRLQYAMSSRLASTGPTTAGPKPTRNLNGKPCRTAVNRCRPGETGQGVTARALASRPGALLPDEPCQTSIYWGHSFLDLFRTAAEAARQCWSRSRTRFLSRFDRDCDRGGKVEMDEAPADLTASERFEKIFRIRTGADGGWAISQPAGRRSLL